MTTRPDPSPCSSDPQAADVPTFGSGDTSNYQDRLCALADFLDTHTGFDHHRVHVMHDGPSIHLTRCDGWRAALAGLTDDLGPARHDQTHPDAFVLRIDDTPLGTVTIYIPRFLERPVVHTGPEVDVDALVNA